ncbi:MAG: BamA/TamA family outer membrane protein [Cyclobacteriaceae bacterium]|nr:BamA/TamA family outer membrane protein [Cyclobacteriaceae bacterium]
MTLSTRSFLILLVSLLSYHFLGAQNKNREAGAFPHPTDTSKFEIAYKNKLLIFPIVALSTETNWVFGLANAYIFKTSKKDPKLRTSTLPSGFLYTLNDQILVALGANIFLPKERYIIRFENSFSKFPDKFWGIGNNTPESNKESYTFTQFYINPQLNRKVKNNIFLGGGIEYQNVFNIKYDPNGNFANQEVLGIYNRSDYHVFGYSLLFTHDSRNHAYMPDKGSLVRIKFSNFNTDLLSDYNFHAYEMDFRKYWKLTTNQTIGFQGYGIFTFGDVPYRNLAVLGGNSMMRGYYAGRYRDKKFIGGQVEYRFPLFWRFGATAFTSVGQVAGELEEINFKRFKAAVGGGLRFSVLPSEKLNLRFDVAYGNSLNYYIVLSEAF